MRFAEEEDHGALLALLLSSQENIGWSAESLASDLEGSGRWALLEDDEDNVLACAKIISSAEDIMYLGFLLGDLKKELLVELETAAYNMNKQTMRAEAIDGAWLTELGYAECGGELRDGRMVVSYRKHLSPVDAQEEEQWSVIEGPPEVEASLMQSLFTALHKEYPADSSQSQ